MRRRNAVKVKFIITKRANVDASKLLLLRMIYILRSTPNLSGMGNKSGSEYEQP